MTLTEAQTQLDAWKAASLRLSRGQIARVGDQRLDRSDWDQVQKAIAYWTRTVNELSRTAVGQSAFGIKLAVFPDSKI